MKGDLHTLKRVCTYASAVMCAGAVASIVIAVAMGVMGAWSFFDNGIRESFISLIKAGKTDLSLASGTIEMVLAFVVLAFVLKSLYGIMSSVQKEHSPFTTDNADICKKVAVALIASAPFLVLLEYLNRGDVLLSVCMLLVTILMAVIAYCLTIIFRYGSILQKESDETL